MRNQIGITWVEFSFFVVIYTYDTCENKLELGHTGRVLVLYLSVDVIWDKNWLSLLHFLLDFNIVQHIG